MEEVERRLFEDVDRLRSTCRGGACTHTQTLRLCAACDCFACCSDACEAAAKLRHATLCKPLANERRRMLLITAGNAGAAQAQTGAPLTKVAAWHAFSEGGTAALLAREDILRVARSNVPYRSCEDAVVSVSVSVCNEPREATRGIFAAAVIACDVLARVSKQHIAAMPLATLRSGLHGLAFHLGGGPDVRMWGDFGATLLPNVDVRHISTLNHMQLRLIVVAAVAAGDPSELAGAAAADFKERVTDPIAVDHHMLARAVVRLMESLSFKGDGDGARVQLIAEHQRATWALLRTTITSGGADQLIAAGALEQLLHAPRVPSDAEAAIATLLRYGCVRFLDDVNKLCTPGAKEEDVRAAVATFWTINTLLNRPSIRTIRSALASPDQVFKGMLTAVRANHCVISTDAECDLALAMTTIATTQAQVKSATKLLVVVLFHIFDENTAITVDHEFSAAERAATPLRSRMLSALATLVARDATFNTNAKLSLFLTSLPCAGVISLAKALRKASKQRDAILADMDDDGVLTPFCERVQTILRGAEACAHCGVAGRRLKACAGCHCVVYCDRECQRGAWPSHREGVCRNYGFPK